MSYKEMSRRLEQLEAEADRQAAIVQEDVDKEAAANAAWQQLYQEMTTATVSDLLNRRPEELAIWTELHRPDLVEGVVKRIVEAYTAHPMEQVYAVGSSEWYFDLCRLLQAPYQRKNWMDARWPRPEHIYWPGDPLYERALGRELPGRTEP